MDALSGDSDVTRTVSVEVSDEVLAALRHDPKAFVLEIRLAAAAKLYELGRVSQELAAEIAGVSRSEFLTALASLRVSPFQDTAETLRDELARG